MKFAIALLQAIESQQLKSFAHEYLVGKAEAERSMEKLRKATI